MKKVSQMHNDLTWIYYKHAHMGRSKILLDVMNSSHDFFFNMYAVICESLLNSLGQIQKDIVLFFWVYFWGCNDAHIDP